MYEYTPFREKIFHRLKISCSSKVLGLHLWHADGTRGCFISPCPHPNGIKYRLNYFDNTGLGKHENHSVNGIPYQSEDQVLLDAIDRGFIQTTNNTIDAIENKKNMPSHTSIGMA